MKNWKKLQFALLTSFAVVLGFGASGCAEERAPIVQAQPNAIKKSDLIGPDSSKPYEWYLRNTVVDTARTNSLAFPGLQDELKRVRFDIQENFLVVRKSFEVVSGTDGKGADPSRNDGIIVAMYPISKHFDVQRGYNPSTGEENNVIVENSSDKPWYDRGYIRVDWTKNLVLDSEGLFYYEKLFGEVKNTGTDWFEMDPKSPFAPKFDTIGNGYFDVTEKMISETGEFWPGFPKCWLINLFSGSDVLDCNVQESTIRVSFMRVENRDYEAIETDSEKWAMFGTFNRDRYGYSRDYELLDRHWHRMASRHNIWKKSHEEGHEECFTGDPVASDDACAKSFGAGSRCDRFGGEVYGKKGVCTLPLEKRELKPVVYYVDQDFPADFWPESVTLVKEWSDAISTGVAYGREAECRLGGGSADSCHSQYFDGETPNTGASILLCHNPVAEEDNAACGEKGLVVRRGDQRYNLLGYVHGPVGGPLGYAPSGSDPLTGEVVQATAYIYGGAIDTYATQARDLVLIANGDLDPAEFSMGAHVTSGLNQDPTAAPGGQPIQATEEQKRLFSTYRDYLNSSKTAGMTDADIAGRLSGIDATKAMGGLAVTSGGSSLDRLNQVQALNTQMALSGVPGFGGPGEALARINELSTQLRGSKTESSLIGTADWRSANGFNTKTPEAFDLVMKETTPFGGKLSPFAVSELFSQIRARQEERGECIFAGDEFNAPHFEGLARRYKEQFKGLGKTERNLAIQQALRKAIYRAVTEHEFGHTMTLRHNFQGSWDSMNFHPNYWKLRTNNGRSLAACTAARSGDTDSCLGPRYLDPETPEELGAGAQPHSGIEEFAYSSIMDYGYDFNTDLHGIGQYDKAAMKYIYGRVVETFPKGSAAGDAVASLHATQDDVRARGLLSEQWWVKRSDTATGAGVQPTHYTTLARVLQQEGYIYDEKRCVNPAEGFEISAIEGKVCEPAKKDHALVSDLVSGDMGDGTYGALWKTKDGRVRWPYRFGTDENSTRPHNLRFDGGADIYEAAVNVTRLYESRYILDNFRRGRRGWVPALSGSRVWERYFRPMQSLGWVAASRTTQYSAMYADKAPAANPALQSDDWGKGYSLAASTLFESLERAILRPQPGNYASKPSVAGQAVPLLQVPDFGADKGPLVGVLDGRWIEDDMDNEKGGSFYYGSFHNRMGVHVEKPYAVAALLLMFPPYRVDTGRAQAVDGRNMLLNFRSVYPRAFDRLLAGIMANDTDVVSPFIKPIPGDSATALPVSYPRLWEADYSIGKGGQATIDPLVGYRLQVPALIYSNWLGGSNGLDTLQRSMRVWIEGGSEAPEIPAGDKEFFAEVGSGVTWAARNYGAETVNGFSKPIGIGHRMIRHANQLLAAVYCTQRNADGSAKYDAAGNLLWTAGNTGKTCDANGNPGAPDPTAKTTYQRYVGVLNVSREFVWDARGDLRGW